MSDKNVNCDSLNRFVIESVIPLASGGALIQFIGGLATEVNKERNEKHHPIKGGIVDMKSECYFSPSDFVNG